MTCTWKLDTQLHRRISVLESGFVCAQSVSIHNIFQSKSTIHDSKLNKVLKYNTSLVILYKPFLPLPDIFISIYSSFKWGTSLWSGRLRVRSPKGSLKLFIDLIFPAALWPSGWLNQQQACAPGMSPGEEKQRVLRTKKLPPSNADCLGIREP